MTLYRAEVINLGNDEDYMNCDIDLRFRQFQVIRETEYFYVIQAGNKERRIGKKSKSCFATPDKEKAVSDAYSRNCRHRGILVAKLDYARKVGKFLKEQL